MLSAVIALGISQPTIAQTESGTEQRLAEGRVLYNENCAICHGADGNGQGSIASSFTPRPRDFTLGAFRFRSTDVGEPPAAADLLRTITTGIEGSYGRSMPAFDQLSFDDKIAVLLVIKDFAGIDELGDSIRVPARPATASAEKGRQLYVEQGCVECHGPNGDGRGILADDLFDDRNMPIPPADFRAGVFKGGNAPEDIWMRIQTGLDGTPMPSFGRNLSLDDSWSLVDYVRAFSENQ